MPKIYTHRQKRHAIYVIQQLNGNIVAASKKLGIHSRTLRDWWFAYQRRDIYPKKDPALDYTGNPGTLTPADLRDHLLKQIETLVKNPATDGRKAYFAALAIDHYLKQIETLNDAIDIDPTPPDPET